MKGSNIKLMNIYSYYLCIHHYEIFINCYNNSNNILHIYLVFTKANFDKPQIEKEIKKSEKEKEIERLISKFYPWLFHIHIQSILHHVCMITRLF